MISFDVLGTPAPKGSSRPMLNRKTGIAFSFAGGSKQAEQKLRSWDANVRDQARLAVGESAAPVFVGVPLAVEITFRMQRPAGHWGKRGLKPSAPLAPASKPDLDKLARSTLDSLTGLVFDDDSRIVELVVRKVFAEPGLEGARIVVCAWPVRGGREVETCGSGRFSASGEVSQQPEPTP